MAADSDDADRRVAQLTELVLGLLEPGERAAVEAEVAGSPALAAELAAVRRTIAALDDETVRPMTPSARLRERVLALQSADRRLEGFVERMASLFDFSRERAREILAAIGDPNAEWVAPGIPGVRLFHFAGGPG